MGEQACPCCSLPLREFEAAGRRIMFAAKEKYLLVRELIHDVLVAVRYVQVRKTQKCILQKLWKRALSVPKTAAAYFRDHSCDVPSIERLHWMHGTPYGMRKSPSVHRADGLARFRH